MRLLSILFLIIVALVIENAGSECVDIKSTAKCEKEMKNGNCKLNRIQKNCQKTCGICTDVEATSTITGYPSTSAVTSSKPSSTQGYPSTAKPTTIGYPSTKEPCEDTSTKCSKFVPKYCTKNKFVMEKCKASCGICDSPTTAGETTTGYPSTESITAGSTTAGTTTGYPSTAPTTTGPASSTTKVSYPSTEETTTDATPKRRLCSARMMNRCRCGCKNAGPPEPKMECNKMQKKMCPCKCNNL